MARLGDLAQRVSKLITDNSPAILTGIGVAGTVATAIFAGRAAVKAERLLAEKSPYLTPREKLARTWKYYIPPVTTGGLTIAAIICASRIGARRTAALAAAYSLTEKAFVEYKDKIVETLGEKKEQKVRDDIAQDRVHAMDPTVVIGDGSQLCHEAYTGRYFLCDMETLRRAQNDINASILHDGYASLSEFYYQIGLPNTKYSDDVGWNTDHLLELQFSGTLTTDGRPCIFVDFAVTPFNNHSKFS